MRDPSFFVATQVPGVVRRGVPTETTPSDDIELDAMTREDDFRAGSGAPLLVEFRDYGSGFGPPLAGNIHAEDRAAAGWARRQDLGTWFMWALTFSAGISGLLFGYEYVVGALPSPSY